MQNCDLHPLYLLLCTTWSWAVQLHDKSYVHNKQANNMHLVYTLHVSQLSSQLSQ